MPARSYDISEQSLQDHVASIKNTIYRDIFEENPEHNRDNVNWMFTSQNSLRLTPMGLKVMMDRYHYGEFELDRPLRGRELIRLKERCRMPYFVTTRAVVLFDSRHIFKAKLMGSIQDWLK